MTVPVQRTGIVVKPNHARVVFRPFLQGDESRTLKILARLMSLTEDEVGAELTSVLQEFRGRHQKPLQFFLAMFERIADSLITDRPPSDNRRLLAGAYFTQEYSLESAALFNPSIVPHPDQAGVPEGAVRMVVSLRATGEGHLSSITFRTGLIGPAGEIRLDKPTGYVSLPTPVPDHEYDKPLFARKLSELALANGISEAVLNLLEDRFTLGELRRATSAVRRQHPDRRTEADATIGGMITLAQSNYRISYDGDTDLSERIIFPFSPTESAGIEDARWVLFTEEDGGQKYYATYSAYDGRVVLPQLVETTDFRDFKITTLNGPMVKNKGFALFPRRIRGSYYMLSRQDGENVYLMPSESLQFWNTKQVLLKPTYPWEFVQLGNCGSPLETGRGWLVLTHGVGPLRKYAIGVVVLDQDDPSRVIGRMAEPLLAPDANEREGYVPNVVYSCGGMIHHDLLILPYAMSDYASTFATVELDEIWEAMTWA